MYQTLCAALKLATMGRGGLNMSEVRTYARAGSYVCLGRKRQLPLPRRVSISLPPHLRALCGGSAGVRAGDVAAGLLDQPRRLPRHVRPHRPAPPASPSSLVLAHSPARACQLCATSCALTPAALFRSATCVLVGILEVPFLCTCMPVCQRVRSSHTRHLSARALPPNPASSLCAACTPTTCSSALLLILALLCACFLRAAGGRAGGRRSR